MVLETVLSLKQMGKRDNCEGRTNGPIRGRFEGLQKLKNELKDQNVNCGQTQGP